LVIVRAFHKALDTAFQAPPRHQDVTLTRQTLNPDIRAHAQNAPSFSPARVGLAQLDDVANR
jgi:hypothetical protein